MLHASKSLHSTVSSISSLMPAWMPPQTTATCLTSSSGDASASTLCRQCDRNRVTMGVLYYNEPDTFKAQLAQWSAWPANLQEQFEFVVVDDCSEPSAALVARNTIMPIRPAGLRIVRVLPPKLPWNIGGARNLLMSVARGCWVVICDLDYALSPTLAQLVFSASLSASKESVFKFRRTRPSKPIHPAIALIRKDLYWEAGGCDEDFVGHYGWTDPHFWHRLQQHIPSPTIIAEAAWPPLTTMSNSEKCRNADPSAQQCNSIIEAHDLIRDPRMNERLFARKKRGDVPWSNRYLRFAWAEDVMNETLNAHAQKHSPRDRAASCSRLSLCDRPTDEFAGLFHPATLAATRNASSGCHTVLYTTQYSSPAGASGVAAELANDLKRRAPSRADLRCQFALMSPAAAALLSDQQSSWVIIPLRLGDAASTITARAASKLPKLQPHLLFPTAQRVVFIDFKLEARISADEMALFALSGTSCTQHVATPYFAAFQHPCVVTGSSVRPAIPAWCGTGKNRSGYRQWSASSWMKREATIVTRKQKVGDASKLHAQTARYAHLMPTSSDMYVDTALLVWRNGRKARCLADSWLAEFLQPKSTDRDQPALAMVLHDILRCRREFGSCLLPPLPPACSHVCSWYCKDCFSKARSRSSLLAPPASPLNAAAAEVFVDASLWGGHGGSAL